MKKLTAVLILAFIAITTAFSTSPTPVTQSVQLTYNLESLFVPAFDIRYNGGASSVSGSTISLNNGTGYGIIAGPTESFELWDMTNVNTAHSITLSVSVDSSWKGQDQENYSSLSIVDFSAVTTNNETNATASKVEGADAILVSYINAGVDRSTDNKQVGQFKVTWPAVPTAPAQNYTANITVNCTTV